MVNKTNTKNMTCDVVVVGAGLVGLSAVIALAEQGKQVVLVDTKKNEADQTKVWDTRIYALTPATEGWLQSLGVWSLVNQARVNNIEAMALWSSESEAPFNLSAEDANLMKLACIVENKNLLQALWQKIAVLGVQVVVGNASSSVDYAEDTVVLSLENGRKISATLLIAADGANSFVRQQLEITTNTKPFNQLGLVANYLTEQDHGDVARQWFAPHATLALLPLPGKYVSMVWSLSTELAKELLKLSGQQLAERVQAETSNALGALKPVSKTLSFELRQLTASKLIGERVLLVGDAAHQVHPMAGQGANLGFRDVIALQKLIANSHAMHDIGEQAFLRQYERVRKADIISMNTLTSGLDSWFSIESPALKKLTSWGMSKLESHQLLKKILIKQAVA
jgi:2-polyprenylphenol 6-hydroxylase